MEADSLHVLQVNRTTHSSWLWPKEIGWIHLKLTFILHEPPAAARDQSNLIFHAESWRYENKFFRRFMEGVGINSWMALEAADITFEVAEGRRGWSEASPATSSANKPTVDGDDGTSLRPRPWPAALLKKVVVRGCGGRKKRPKNERTGLERTIVLYMCLKFKVCRTLFLSGSMFGFKAKTF